MDCLLAVDFAQASSVPAQSVPAICFSVEQAESEGEQKALRSVLVLLPCSTLR